LILGTAVESDDDFAADYGFAADFCDEQEENNQEESLYHIRFIRIEVRIGIDKYGKLLAGRINNKVKFISIMRNAQQGLTFHRPRGIGIDFSRGCCLGWGNCPPTILLITARSIALTRCI
jgi:hypothetical protein